MISGRIKDIPLLGLKYNIIDDDKLCTAVDTPEIIYDIINKEYLMETLNT